MPRGQAWRTILLVGVAAVTAASACSPKPPTAPSSSLAIASQPQHQTVSMGGQATLSVGGLGSGPLSYQWHVGLSGTVSEPIAGATASTYTTPPLLATTSYWARVSDTSGAADSATATVTVTPPSGGAGPAPTITTEPENETIEPGQTAKLDVGVNGADPLSYQWFVGPSGTTMAPIAGATTDVFWTPELDRTTSYWVRVWNSAGMTDSMTATITVSTMPAPPAGAPTVVTQPEDQTVGPGATASLLVEATGADPLSYQWFVGPSGDTSSPVTSATFAGFTTAPLTATTSFWVRVSNAEGTAESEAATVSVSGPTGPPPPPPPPATAPTITTHPQDQTIASGQAATLSVVASGTAPFMYQWYEGPSGSTSIPIGGAGSPSLTTLSLTTTTTYWVRVSNAYGSADSGAATVTVTTGSSSSAFENDVLVLVNQARAAGATCGGTPYPAVGPLTMDASLVSAARGHSLDMAVNNYFSHTSLDGRAFDDRMRDAGYSGAFPWGENIAAGYSSPQAAVNGWMASTGHCRNIMKSSYQVIGVGHVYLAGSSYGNYWTQDFGGS